MNLPGNASRRPSVADFRALFRLGAPVIVTQLGVITVAFADTMMVGAYSLDALAASAFVNSLFLVPIVMLIGFAGGVTPLVGALYSRNDYNGLSRIFRASLRVNFAMSLAAMAIMGAMWFFLDRMGQPDELMPLIKRYYLILLWSMIPAAVFNCCQQTANGTTDTARPMWVILGTNFLNIAGNYILIFGKFGAPEMGLDGAGLSTVVARWAGMLVMMYILLRTRRYRPMTARREGEEPLRRLYGKVWTTSYPVMIQSGVECLLWSFGAVVCGWFGKVQIAAYQVVNTIGQLGFMIYMSFGVAVSIRVANFTGTHDLDGIRRTTKAGMALNFVLAALASLAFFLFDVGLIRLFTDSEEVVASAHHLIWPLILYQFCDAAQLTFSNAQRGTSVVAPLLWASLISYVAIGIPLAVLFGKTMDMGNLGVYYSFCVSLAAAAVLLGFWYNRTLARRDFSNVRSLRP